MAKIFGQLEKAQLENTTSDTASLPKGMATYRTDLNVAKVSDGATMKELVDTSTAQTLTSKTLTSPTLTTPNTEVIGLDGQASTPSTPAAGFYKAYVKDSTGKLTVLNSAGTETTVGGGGSSGINYITNPDAETDTTGFATYADAAATSPVDGTGGAPNVTFTRTTSSPLRNVASFLITKDAANRQGEGASYDFTINSADQGKVLQGSFDYAIASGTFADNDISVWIYDVTNAALIQPAPYLLKNHSLPSERMPFEFQTASNSTSYRLIFHTASTSALAYTVKVDNLAVGPTAKLYGSAVTDWVSYTPTGAFTNTTFTGKWRRVGDTMEIRGQATCTGTPGAATFTFSLPSGFTIDTAKLISTDQTSILGVAKILDSGTAHYKGDLRYSTSSSVSVAYWSSSGAYVQDSGLVDASNPHAFAINDVVQVEIKVPIVGWSSSVIMSSDASTRVVAARATNNVATTIATSGDTLIPYLLTSGSVYDTHGGWDSSIYTVKVPGKYRINAKIRLTDSQSFTAGDYIALFAKIDNATYYTLSSYSTQTTGNVGYGAIINGSVELDLTAGQTIRIVTNTVLAATKTTLASSPNYTSCEISLIQGPAQIAASESVQSKYTHTAGTSLPNNTSTLINWANKVYDSHNSVTTGASWKFTAPVSGNYLVTGTANMVFTASSVNSAEFNLQLHVNGSGGSVLGGRVFDVANNAYAYASGSTTIKLLAGEYIDVRAFHNTGATQTMSTSPNNNHISIVKIGNY